MLSAITGGGWSAIQSIQPVRAAPVKNSPLAYREAQVETKNVEKVVDKRDAAGDSVEISLLAEIKLLKSQGLSVEAIAARLGLAVELVKQYLGLR